MAHFHQRTYLRCIELQNILSDSGMRYTRSLRRLIDPPQGEFLAYHVTDPDGEEWTITPVTRGQVTPSAPSKIWQASSNLYRSKVCSARKVVAAVKG